MSPTCRQTNSCLFQGLKQQNVSINHTNIDTTKPYATQFHGTKAETTHATVKPQKHHNNKTQYQTMTQTLQTLRTT